MKGPSFGLLSTAEKLVTDAYEHNIQRHAIHAQGIRFSVCGSNQVRAWTTNCETVEAVVAKTNWNWKEELCCVHQIANLCAELPKHLTFIAIHNRTVNVEGKVGRGKPLDQMIEHYNL